MKRPPFRLVAAALIIGPTLFLAWQGQITGQAALAVFISVGAALGVYQQRKRS